MTIGVGEAMLYSTGANILAGAFGGGDNTPTGTNYNMHRELNQRQRFRNQEKHWQRRDARWNLKNIYGRQLQTKVKDAKKAGLHPLFALGSSGYTPPATSTPPPSPAGQSQTGSFANDALTALATGFANFATVQAEKDLTEMQIEASNARLAGQPGNGNDGAAGIEAIAIDEAKAADTNKGLVALEPSIQRTRSKTDSSKSAGSNPAFMSVEIWPGVFMDVPWSEEGFAESLDSLPTLAITVARNLGVGANKAYNALKAKLIEYHKNKPKTKGAGARAARAIPLGKNHPGAYRRRNYAGVQPYKPRGWR